MSIKQLMILTALATAAASASASVEHWGTLGTTPSVDKADVGTRSFDNIYTFELVAPGSVDAYASSFEDRSTGIVDGLVTLYEGRRGHGVSLGSFTFGVAQEQVFANLSPDHYYFELTGTGVKAGGSYDFEAYVPAVPEPAGGALLLAGLGMMGFMARRRR